MRLGFAGGDGVLARNGELVVLCSADESSAPSVTEMLAALERVGTAGGDADELAAELEPLTAGRGMDMVAFGPAGESIVVVVHGRAWAEVLTEHGQQRLALTNPNEGVRSQVPGRVLRVRAGLGEVGNDTELSGWSNLQAGTVRADALELTAQAEPDVPAEAHPPAEAQPEAQPELLLPEASPAGEPGPPTMPEMPAPSVSVDPAGPFSSVNLLGGGPADLQAQARDPLPIATRPAPPAPDVAVPAHPAAAGVQVMGVYCKNGHFDDPTARYCAICGISMAQQTLLPRLGPRPPLGVLVLDDGAIFSLDSDYVIGRDPYRDPDVASGTARPLRIDDPEGLLSRVHARVHLDGWQVQVVDLGSANGTGLWGPYDTAWQRGPGNTAVTIRPGTQVGIGRRQFRYESHRNT